MRNLHDDGTAPIRWMFVTLLALAILTVSVISWRTRMLEDELLHVRSDNVNLSTQMAFNRADFLRNHAITQHKLDRVMQKLAIQDKQIKTNAVGLKKTAAKLKGK